jgi:hypothetical protein
MKNIPLLLATFHLTIRFFLRIQLFLFFFSPMLFMPFMFSLSTNVDHILSTQCFRELNAFEFFLKQNRMNQYDS